MSDSSDYGFWLLMLTLCTISSCSTGSENETKIEQLEQKVQTLEADLETERLNR